MGSWRVGYDWATEQQQQLYKLLVRFMVLCHLYILCIYWIKWIKLCNNYRKKNHPRKNHVVILINAEKVVGKIKTSSKLRLEERVSHSVMSNFLWPHGQEPARLLCSWNSPGQNTGVGSHFLLQGIFQIKPGSPELKADSLPSEPRGEPKIKRTLR